VSSALLSIVCDRVRTSSMVTRDALEMRLSGVLGAGPTLEQVLAFCEYILDLPSLRAIGSGSDPWQSAPFAALHCRAKAY
jgi:hypothetical protein